jgi:hypothetical protein
MPKPAVSPERKAARVLAALGVALVGVVAAAQVSNSHHPQASAGDQAIATAVSNADPAPAPGILPTMARHADTHPTMVAEASGDPILAHGFGHLRTAGGVTYANLTVYPVYRTAPAQTLPAVTTLGAAMGNGVVSVVEPSLTVTNTGPQPTYVPGGTVVPGGGQDQGVAHDAVIPARSGNVAVDSFCVEAGRSFGPTQSFHADVAMAIPSVRYAMQVGADQEMVWDSVDKATEHFGAQSETKAYHALDKSTAAQTAATPYVSAIADSLADGKAVGAVVAINGKIVCADVYRDSALFAQMAPALLHSYALQAAMTETGEPASNVSAASAGQWVASLDAAPGAQDGSAPSTLDAHVGTSAGAGVRTAMTAGSKSLLHEAFWTPAAALTNRS